MICSTSSNISLACTFYVPGYVKVRDRKGLMKAESDSNKGASVPRDWISDKNSKRPWERYSRHGKPVVRQVGSNRFLRDL